MAKAGLLSLLCPLLAAAFLVHCHASEKKVEFFLLKYSYSVEVCLSDHFHSQVHIVYMGERRQGDSSPASTPDSMLAGIMGSSESAKKCLVYSYGRSFNGFAARLSDEEVEKLSEMEGVVSVIPDRILKLHTTRSWDFVGFSKGKLGAPLEADVVIGLLDTGIWPESDSFNDEGMSAPPAKWKGKCVGANFTCNKKFVAQVVLGNGQVLSGLSINNFDLNGTTYPLIWGGNAANFSAGASPAIAGFCSPGALNSYKVERKIVLCDAMVTGSQILIANGVGVIMSSSFYSVDFAFSFPLPAAVISNEDRVKVLNYIRATENPIATILVAQGWKDVMAASVVSFSSRGPNPITPDILKPDITAPGVDILAAWSPLAHPSIDRKDSRRVNFNIISGTSMSCPHASAAAAYVKAGHPNWSPAAIKSALMTTGEKPTDRTIGASIRYPLLTHLFP
ncbi:PROPROTEIN CONVERTASE SUBTILISIN/KEXIN [Salix purpurea]|uniref:PROPROTEIN CONVERTASE SUBTILISIN/KEXIN n=1 Tax=Salix purpurea TaxID=77065 RepID=A0A9Q0T966_SALPP|nr:PROPROTEIN CONVERTASE SUBTILISIN/KEXIN [Salix purpurea]